MVVGGRVRIIRLGSKKAGPGQIHSTSLTSISLKDTTMEGPCLPPFRALRRISLTSIFVSLVLSLVLLISCKGPTYSVRLSNDTSQDVLLEYCVEDGTLLRANEIKSFKIVNSACAVHIYGGKSLGAPVSGPYVGCLGIPSDALTAEITISISSAEKDIDRLSCQRIEIGETPTTRK